MNFNLSIFYAVMFVLAVVLSYASMALTHKKWINPLESSNLGTVFLAGVFTVGMTTILAWLFYYYNMFFA